MRKEDLEQPKTEEQKIEGVAVEAEKDMETRAKILAVAIYEIYRYSHKRFNETRMQRATVVQKNQALQDLNRMFGAAKTALEMSGVEISKAAELHGDMKNPLIIT